MSALYTHARPNCAKKASHAGQTERGGSAAPPPAKAHLDSCDVNTRHLHPRLASSNDGLKRLMTHTSCVSVGRNGSLSPRVAFKAARHPSDQLDSVDT